MPGPRLRILWICGAPGAGKSVAAWALFGELAAAPDRVAYVDIDQLGMLYPASDDDPQRHALKAEALGALVPGYVAAGARTLIVSGVVDVAAGPVTALTEETDLTMVLLSPGPVALRRRILARGSSEEDAGDAVAEDALLHHGAFVDHAIETAGLSVTDTVARLRELIPSPEPPQGEPHPTVSSGAGMRVMVLTGPRAAGSSTVGFGVATHRWAAGRRTGFVDLQQLGFVSSRGGQVSSDATLAIGELARMHDLMTARGAELLLVSGHLSVPERAALKAVLPAARVTVVRLRADRQSFEDHVRARVRGRGPRLAGDDLLDADRPHQERVVAAALAEQQVLDTAAVDDVVLDVSGRALADVIAEVEGERTE